MLEFIVGFFKNPLSNRCIAIEINFVLQTWCELYPLLLTMHAQHVLQRIPCQQEQQRENKAFPDNTICGIITHHLQTLN